MRELVAREVTLCAGRAERSKGAARWARLLRTGGAVRCPALLRGRCLSARVGDLTIPDLAARLRDTGVLVSDLSNQLAREYIPVSVGTRAQNDAFLDAFQRITGETG